MNETNSTKEFSLKYVQDVVTRLKKKSGIEHKRSCTPANMQLLSNYVDNAQEPKNEKEEIERCIEGKFLLYAYMLNSLSTKGFMENMGKDLVKELNKKFGNNGTM